MQSAPKSGPSCMRNSNVNEQCSAYSTKNWQSNKIDKLT